ncbi:MAG: hypothetical protein K9L68_00665 [Spirochaetales bacterium]|nr:hypothetical protein [Spirochaetales bacterium]MCF7937088.1 hypothetical protein [Spirochaetales bacterium]
MSAPSQSGEEKLIRLLHSMDSATLQNRLMRIQDRSLALSMLYLQKTDRELLFSKLGKSKQTRVREELGFQEHLRITYAQYRLALDIVLSELGRASPGGGMKSYLKPISRRRSEEQ